MLDTLPGLIAERAIAFDVWGRESFSDSSDCREEIMIIHKDIAQNSAVGAIFRPLE